MTKNKRHITIHHRRRAFIPIVSAIIFGNIDKKSARERIYAVLSLSFGALMTFAGVFFAFLTATTAFGITILVFGGLGFGLLYYFSRFKNKTNSWLFLVLFLFLFFEIWYNEHGFYGDIQLLLIPGILAFISIFKPKQYFNVFLIIFIYLGILFGLENYYTKIFLLDEIKIPEYQPIIVYVFTLFVSSWVVGLIVFNNNLKIDELDKQKDNIDKLYNNVLSSVNYAYNIQNAVLPSKEKIKHILPEHFILYKPRDVVSGDFYWINKNEENRTFVVVADCTGHGIPGAFMSMLGISLLNEIILREKITSPENILEELRERVKKTIPDLNDGMDMGICSYDEDSNKMLFSGANIPLYIVKNNELNTIQPSHQPIGKYPVEKDFILNEIKIQGNEVFYMSSDGYKDQIGGKKRTKFMSSRFKKMLLENSNKPLPEQKEIFDNIFKKWIEEHNENSLLPDIDFKKFFANLNNEQIEKRKQDMEKRIVEIRQRVTKSKTFAQINSEIHDHTKEMSYQIEQIDDVLVIGFKISK